MRIIFFTLLFSLTGLSVPGFLFIPTGGFSRNEWTKSTYFKMLLSADTYEHVAGKPVTGIHERIENYTTLYQISCSRKPVYDQWGVLLSVLR
jgi:hypothetical protein